MKFICAQSDLSSHLSTVNRAVPSRPTRTVLANVLCTTDLADQTVTLVGFDEVTGIRVSFNAQIETEGTLALPAKLLSDIVARLPAEDITVAVLADNLGVSLTCSAGRYEVRGQSAEDYPALPTIDQAETQAFAAEGLLDGLRGSLFATSADETKQVLTGVHLLADGDALEFAATDGHRLAVVQPVAEDGKTVPVAVDVTVPAKALRELERMLQGYTSADPVTVQLDETQAVFHVGTQLLTTRLLDGQYPNYRQLLPKQFARQVSLDRRLLVASLERIAVLATAKNDIVKISLQPDAQQLEISVEAQEVGSGKEVVPAQINGDELDIAFNVRYLLDGLKAFGTGEVQLECNSSTSPAVWSPLGALKMTYLVMPVQIRS